MTRLIARTTMMGMRSGRVIFEPDGGLAGGRTVPLSLVRVWRRVKIVPAAEGGRPIRQVKSVTDYKEFPGRSHYSVIGGEGWVEVADYALDWAVEHAGTGTAG